MTRILRLSAFGLSVFATAVLHCPTPGFHAPTLSAYAQQVAPDIFSFYQTALAVAQATREQDLFIVCQKPLPDKIFTNEGSMYVTFLAGNTKKIVLAVFTKGPLNDLSTFHLRNQRGIEWMFVFDRNRDGKVDYILWPIGTEPYIEGPPPPGFPKRTGTSTIVNMTREQSALFMRYAKLIFWHWADENFEGNLSAIILGAYDPGGLIAITGWQLIRSSHFDGVLDQCWYFAGNINNKTGECERAGQGYKTRTFNTRDITPDDLMKMSVWFAMVNEGAGQCALTGDSF